MPLSSCAKLAHYHANYIATLSEYCLFHDYLVIMQSDCRNANLVVSRYLSVALIKFGTYISICLHLKLQWGVGLQLGMVRMGGWKVEHG